MNKRILLYLHYKLREIYKSEITSFQKLFNERLFPSFNNIENEAEKYTEDEYDRLGSQVHPEWIDMSDIADQALEKGANYFEELSRVKYAFTAMAITSLYHMWEQQVRRFLYKEMRHDFRLEMSEFCTGGVKDILKIFNYYQVDLTGFECWDNIDELRLLCNVLKHGAGKSAQQLYQINSDLFKKSWLNYSEPRFLETTLLDENMNINQGLFNQYAISLVTFWSVLPERCYLKE